MDKASRLSESNENNGKEVLILKEIDLLQDCITRMAHNSFMIKGWVLTIVVSVVALLPQKVNSSQEAIRNTCLLCIFAFSILDSYNIFLERCYRVKYDWVVKNREYTDFLFLDLNPKNRPMTVNDGQYKKESFSVLLSLRRSISLPTVFFYGVLMTLMWFVLSGN